MKNNKALQKKRTLPKTKYKLNVYLKGTIYADSIIDLTYKFLTGKYTSYESFSLDQRKRPRKNEELDVAVGPLNS